jgi:hypothetical protein
MTSIDAVSRRQDTGVTAGSERRYEKVSIEIPAIQQLRNLSHELTNPERGRVTLSKAILLLIDFYRGNGIERDEFADVIESLNHTAKRQ